MQQKSRILVAVWISTLGFVASPPSCASSTRAAVLSSESTPFSLTFYNIEDGVQGRATVSGKTEIKLSDGPFRPVNLEHTIGSENYLGYAELSEDHHHMLCYWGMLRSPRRDFMSLIRVYDLWDKKAVCEIPFVNAEMPEYYGWLDNEHIYYTLLQGSGVTEKSVYSISIPTGRKTLIAVVARDAPPFDGPNTYWSHALRCASSI